MPLEISSISQITPAIEPCKIKVRIVRLWGFPKKDKPGEFNGMDLLLVDDKGSRIQASIKGSLLSKFQKQLEEGECYILMNFELCPNLGQFRSSSHPYKINFTFYTCVKHCEQLPNLHVQFNFCPFSEILARTNDNDVFIDIIGEIVGMNEVKSISTIDGPTKLLNLQLKDLGDTLLDVALWGKFAEDTHSQITSQKPGPVILLGSLMKTALFKGKGTAQSTKFATKIIINSSLQEITDFQEALCDGEPETSRSIIEIKSSHSVQPDKTTFSLSDQKTLAQLKALNEKMICDILASIALESNSSWYYIGCTTCYTKVVPYFNPITEETEPGKFSCEKCKKQIATTQPRFKLGVKATDHTGTSSFILFDDVVIPLIKKSVYELLEQQVQFNRSSEIPQELLDMNGRNYVLKVLASEKETYNRSSTDKVLSLTNDPKTIKSFTENAYTLNESRTKTVSGSTVGTPTQTNTVTSETDNVESDASNVSLLTPTPKRPLPLGEDHNAQHSSTKPKLMSKYIKKEKK